jgi:hypothetical protein
MKRTVLAGFGLVLGLAAMSGCVPQPAPPQVALVPEAPPPPPAPPPVALMPVAAPVWVPTVRHHAARVAHPMAHVAAHHHWVRRYSSVRTSYAPAWSPQCGSVAHPCTVEHIAVPIE